MRVWKPIDLDIQLQYMYCIVQCRMDSWKLCVLCYIYPWTIPERKCLRRRTREYKPISFLFFIFFLSVICLTSSLLRIFLTNYSYIKILSWLCLDSKVDYCHRCYWIIFYTYTFFFFQPTHFCESSLKIKKKKNTISDTSLSFHCRDTHRIN